MNCEPPCAGESPIGSPEPRNLRRAGERGVLLDLGAEDPARLADSIHHWAGQHAVDLVEVVPGARTVLVVFRSAAVRQVQQGCLANLAPVSATRPIGGSDPVVEIATRYDGPDLDWVAAGARLSRTAVVDLHSGAEYEARFAGFAPGFVYLSGLPPALRLPRRATPRASVPAGSIGIADEFTAVYPRPSPGGWHLLATTDAVMWDAQRDSPALIVPGQSVRFVPVGRLPR
jgi:KipI family sensor histidine kinase inhibitor